jgi:putative Holliday junction resolvase
MRILGVDPGKRNIGIALSDPTKTLATPLTIIQHSSRMKNAESIAAIAEDNSVGLIVIGQSLGLNGKPTLSGRSATRLAAAIRRQSNIPVILWDEGNSTQIAQSIMARIKGRGVDNHLDDLAAAVILQSYLDAQSQL